MSNPEPGQARSDWLRIKATFEALLELPPAAREAHLAAAAAGPEALGPEALAEVRSLLAHHDAAATGGGGARGSAFLAADASSQLAETPAPAVLPGQRLGAWEVVRAFGAGGMGVVFEARRADGSYEGRAAVKLLKRGMDSAAVLQRFAQERQALARLSHPHIARLLDAGASEQGLPYFVLEFVDGQAVDAAVVGLPLDARLQLFLQLADAVAHAHRNLLVHRDLKPGNVLVDREGQVKLLDFGIAKALDPLEHRPGEESGHTTVAGQRPYTPHYASPEQIRGEPVSTATDIYSLGVLLYQMLTGTRPTGRKATTPAEAARSVLEDEPTRPSRLSPTEAVDPQWLATRKKLEGDLDNILLKALEKEPARRYASVDALAADVRAYLGGYPVGARPAGRVYLLAKFARRNRGVVAASGAAVLALVGGLAVSAWQAEQARQARDEARARLGQTRDIARDLVMRYADTVMYLPGGMKMQVEMLTDTVRHLDNLAIDAASDPAYAGDVATAYARLATLQVENFTANRADPAEGARNVARALELFPVGAPAHTADARYSVWWARALQSQTHLRRSAGDLPGAMAASQQRVALMESTLSRFPGHMPARSELGSAWFGIGQLNFTFGTAHLARPDEALAAFEKSEKLYLALMRDQPDDFTHPNQLGTIAGARLFILQAQDRMDEALAQGRLAVSYKQAAQQLAPNNVGVRNSVATEANNLGAALVDAGQAEEAVRFTTLSRSTLDALVRDDPQVPRWAQQRLSGALHLGRALLAAGQPAAALAPLREAIQAMESATAGALVRRRALGRLSLAQALLALRQPAAAQEVAAALQDLAVFLKASPTDADALVLQGQALHLRADLPGRTPAERQADLALARASFEQAAQAKPLRAHQQRAQQALLQAR
jgi:tetratricopeptide (TPR) repeat protein